MVSKRQNLKAEGGMRKAETKLAGGGVMTLASCPCHSERQRGILDPKVVTQCFYLELRTLSLELKMEVVT